MNEVCKDCRKPIHWAEQGTEEGGTWYHDELTDFWNCPTVLAAAIEPARDDTFDMLTRDQLYDLHSTLARAHQALNARIIGPDYQPIITVLSEEWNIVSAACAEVSETMAAVFDEIDRRGTEAEILRELTRDA